MAEGADKADVEQDDHPGRPRAADELDPELMKLPKRRTKIGWLLSVAVITFCAYWMVVLRADLAYSRAGSSPVAAELAALPGLASESFVSTTLVPDRPQTARIWTGADLGVHAAPVLGSGGAVWLVTSGSAFAGPPAYDNRYVGRLVRLGDMPFFSQLREFYADSPAPLEPISLDAFSQALTTNSPPTTAHGDALAVSASTRVRLDWRPAGRLWIIVSPEADGPSDSLSWRTALESRAGLAIRGEIEGDDSSRVPTWTFEVSAPSGRDAIVSKLAEVGLSAARVAPVQESLASSWGELRLESDTVVLGAAIVPRAEISQVAVEKRVTPREDAVVLITGEEPGDFWYILPLYMLFGLLLLLFAWTLSKTLRGSEPPTAAA